MTFVTGQRVVSVMAELATFIGARQEPTGPVETFSTDVAAETATRQIATEDAATILLRFENGARGAVNISQISAGRKNSLQYEIDGSTSSLAWDSEQPDQIWVGHRERPNEILIRNPALMGHPVAPRRRFPAGMSRASPTRSLPISGRSTRTSSRVDRRPARLPDLRGWPR